MKFHLLFCILGLLHAGFASAGRSDSAPTDTHCEGLSREVAETEVDFRPPLQAKVGGKGRLYFHSAPSAACIDKKTFVIPGDALTVYTPHDGWMKVMYISRDGDDFIGWVEERRLALGDAYGSGNASSALPMDVQAFVGRRDECEHFLGEEPYDKDRRAYLEDAIRETCGGSNQQLDTLRKKYHDNAEVLDALAGYEMIAE